MVRFVADVDKCELGIVVVDEVVLELLMVSGLAASRCNDF